MLMTTMCLVSEDRRKSIILHTADHEKNCFSSNFHPYNITLSVVRVQISSLLVRVAAISSKRVCVFGWFVRMENNKFYTPDPVLTILFKNILKHLTLKSSKYLGIFTSAPKLDVLEKRVYCFVSYFMPCLEKYSQSETRIAVSYLQYATGSFPLYFTAITCAQQLRNFSTIANVS